MLSVLLSHWSHCPPLSHHPDCAGGTWRRESQTWEARSQLVWEHPKAFPSQPRDVISSVCPGSSSGSPSGWACVEDLVLEASCPQLAPLEVHKLYSEFLLQYSSTLVCQSDLRPLSFLGSLGLTLSIVGIFLDICNVGLNRRDSPWWNPLRRIIL